MDLVDQLAALPVEVIRASQRDVYFAAVLGRDLSDLAARLLGNAVAVQHKPEIALGARLLYYYITVARGVQTLGEEYCEVDNFDGRTQLPLVPSGRGVLASCLAVVPYVAERGTPRLRSWLLAACERVVQDHPPADSSLGRLAEFVHRQLSETPQCVSSVLAWVTRLHMAVFLFTSTYYAITRRVLGVRYVSRRRGEAQQASDFRVLGTLALVPVVVDFVQAATMLVQGVRRGAEKGNAGDGGLAGPDQADWTASIVKQVPGPQCILCLSPRTRPTVTPCGHVFCWTCVYQWCCTKGECPLCRQPATPQDLVACYQF